MKRPETVWTLNGRTDTPNDNSPAVLPDESIRHLHDGLLGISPKGNVMFQGMGAIHLAVNSATGEMATGAFRATQSAVREYTSVIYLNPNGTLKWSDKVMRGGGSMPIFGPNSTLFIGVGGGSTVAYNADGSVKWSHGTGGYDKFYALGKVGKLYMANDFGLTAFNAQSGAIEWTLSGLGKTVGSIAIDSNDRVFVANTTGQLHCVAPNGSLVWTKQICTEFTTGPAIGLNGTLAIAGKQGFAHYLFQVR